MFGVIDIGSNSVRLVVFEAASRNPITLFNEKAICAIGRNMVTTGRLDPEGMKLALAALRRFRAVSEGMGVKRIEVVATAAARDAANGPDFVRLAEEASGQKVQVLTGQQEAELAALGVVCGLPDADGLVGDLGGGSLELTEVARGAFGIGATLPFGPLRLMDAAKGRIDRAIQIVDERLAQFQGLDQMRGRTLYAVGGVWRNIARLHMARSKYPLHVLHGYEMSSSGVQRITSMIMGLKRKPIDRLPGIARRRVEALPFGAAVLNRVMAHGHFDRVIVSAFGVREGVLYRSLDAKTRALDPLYVTSGETAERFGRRPGQVTEIEQFLTPLFENDDPEQARLRRAACLLSDSGWRQHPDHRAEITLRYILQAQIAGIRHYGRAFLALTLWHRYGGDLKHGLTAPLEKMIGPQESRRAMALGQALRLSYVLGGSATGLGSAFTLALRPNGLTLSIARERADIRGEAVEKRLEELAATLGRTARITLKS